MESGSFPSPRARGRRRQVVGLLLLWALGVYPAGASALDENVPAVRLQRRSTMALDPDGGAVAVPAPQAALVLPPAIASSFPNILVNDPTGQLPLSGNTQMEPSLAACGDTLVCAFTDSEGLWATGTLTGYAVSFDAGQTWYDGGSVPRAGTTPTEQVYGDPCMLTDGAGHWYVVSVYDVGNGVGGELGDMGIVVNTGRFLGANLQWSGPRLIAGGAPGNAFDSPHAAIDPVRDRIYVAYSNLSASITWGQIEVATLGSHGTVTLYSTVVQPQVTDVNNAGADVAVGPEGEVYVAWESGLLTNNGQGPAFQHIARSLDQGLTFSAPVVAGTVIESWCSGPPGFNREEEFVEFPSIAVDRSNGPRRGRVYLTWHDAVPRDFTGTLVPVAESNSNNDSPQSAQILPAGNHLQINGGMYSGDYEDWYRFQGTAGEHVRFLLEPVGWTKFSTRLLCANPSGGGADTLLAASSRDTGRWTFFLFTLPTDGEYLIQITRSYYTGSYHGYFRKTTVTTPAVAIDHRDVVVISSPDGMSDWSPKVRVNDDTGYTDQAFPAVVVDGSGGVHVTWYDRRFDPRCRARADLMLSSSFDGGASFTPNLRVTSGSSSWQVPADASPNFGDSFRPLADGERLFPVWADGRLGSPDVMIAPILTSFDVDIPTEKTVEAGMPVDLAVTLRNDTPFDDAAFQVVVDSDHAAFPDQTIDVGPVPSGSTEVALYSPVPSEPYGSATLTVTVTSNRSAVTRSSTIAIYEGPIAVHLTDFAARVDDAGVHLAWTADDATSFHVERAPEAVGPFERLTVQPVEAVQRRGRYEFCDATAPPGQTVHYRLLARDEDGATQAFGPYAVHAEAPRAVALLGAQPNPFNPSTAIRFELPQAAAVTLRILDVRGRVVRVLLDGVARPPGRHAVSWDGRSSAGTPQPSGVYVAELRALGAARAARLVLLR